MESTWSALAVVAAVFTVFSGAAMAWGRLQARRRQRHEDHWRQALKPTAAAEAQAPVPSTPAAPTTARAATVAAVVAAPVVAAASLAATEVQARRNALDLTLDRMARQPGAPADADDPHHDEWRDTEPLVSKAAMPDFEPTRPFDHHD